MPLRALQWAPDELTPGYGHRQSFF